jgi:hypothetical protein
MVRILLIKSKKSGFCGVMNYFLALICEALKRDMVPVIDIDHMYHPLFDNIWLDYFEVFNKEYLVKSKTNEIITSIEWIASGELDRKFWKKYCMPKLWLDPEFEIKKGVMQKYFRINQVTQKHLDESLDKLGFKSEYKILGVHARGTNARTFDARYLPYIKKIFEGETKRYDKIFLATEDKDNLQQFIDYFSYDSSILLYNKCYRYDTEAVKGGTQEGNIRIVNIEGALRQDYGKIVTNPKYMMGLEVLTDALCLSKCDAIITAVSGVGVYAIYNSNTIKQYYTYDDFIMDGI